MKRNKYTVVKSLEDLVSICNTNFEWVEQSMLRMAKKNKRATFLSVLASVGTLYLFKKNKELADKVDRLEEDHKNLSDEYSRHVEEI